MNKLIKICSICNSEFTKPRNESIKDWNSKHKFCSRKCYNKSLIGRIAWNKGNKIPKDKLIGYGNWRGGISSQNQKERNSIEIKLWRKSCLERDNFICQVSGQKGGELVIHHINNFADFPELRTSIENGITMTKKLHQKFHKIYGFRNNTKEQLNEFIINYTA